jgi:nitroreductase
MLDSIKNRRSIFPPQFNENEISATEITVLLEAANCAPSHFKSEPWRFKILHSIESKKAFAEFISETYKNKVAKFSETKYKKLQGLPLKSAAVIAICMQRDEKERMPEWEEIAAVSMAVQNLWLQATEMNMGGYWSSPELIIKEIHHFFELDKKQSCLGFFYLGKHDTPLVDKKRGNIEEKTTWL